MDGLFGRCVWISFLALSVMMGPPAAKGRTSPGKPVFTHDRTVTIAGLSRQLAKARGLERIQLWLRRGEVYRDLGYYPRARADFQAALDLARNLERPVLAAAASQALGYACFLAQRTEEAKSLLRQALDQAKALNQPALAGSGANRLATLLFRQDRREEAYILYQQALEYARKAGDLALIAGIQRNMARALQDDKKALNRLKAAKKAAFQVKTPYEKAQLLLGIAAEARQRESKQAANLIDTSLTAAIRIARELGDTRLYSQAAGALGGFHEQQGRLDLARHFTDQALFAAQSLEAHDLLLQWNWQMGRLFGADGNRQAAILALRRAVYHINAIRQDIPIQYQDGRSSFRQTLAPIYMGLADLLLRAAGAANQDAANQDAAKQKLLREAREVVEQVKQSELRDYFKDPCVAARSRSIEALSPDTAVLYPIILADRLELLVDIQGRLLRKRSPVGQKQLERAINRLVFQLRNNQGFEISAKQVYDWLIQPVAPILADHRIKTLVFVPDGVFRMLPVAALWDGNRFVLERYAVVTTPGLSLMEAAPLGKRKMACLLAGMSEPGPVLSDLPDEFLNAIRASAARGTRKGVRGLSVAPPPEKGRTRTIPAGKPSPEEMETIRQYLALPGVETEIERIARQLPGKVLMNEEFALERFSIELDHLAYPVVHIASHGFFGGSPEMNFLMTFNKRLNMNQLETLIGPKQLAARPVELIFMSACQTAEGDDRSPLGLAGLVLKSGARSALGTLWPVSDQAAQELVPLFYAHLKEGDCSKAESLRRAQLILMQNGKFHHPFYWSPFILVGNWL